MTLADALRNAAAAGLSRLDAQLLLLHVLGRPGSDRAWLIAHDDAMLAESAATPFDGLCARRAAGEPVAYLVGQKEFFGLALQVDARVLVPRPETEILVEWALELLPAESTARVLDLGTGSGAIALALQHARPGLRVEAVDASEDALAVAQANAVQHGLPVRFGRSSWFDAIEGRFDMLVSNPPYVRADDPHLAALGHEPLSALAAGADGLDDIRSIIAEASAHLQPGGWLLFEHGWDQGPAVRALLDRAGFTATQTRQDLAGIDRCTGGRRPELG